MPFRPQGEVTKIGFFLVPDFSLMAFTSAIEPLRLANRSSGRELFRWNIYSLDGEAVRSSCGIELSVDDKYRAADRLAAAVVCSGIHVNDHDHRELIATLRRLSSFGSSIGALCTGTHVLAKAGLLNGTAAPFTGRTTPVSRPIFRTWTFPRSYSRSTATGSHALAAPRRLT